MSRMIDRLLRGPTIPPYWGGVPYRMPYAEGQSMPVFLADNVSTFYWHHEQDYWDFGEDYPNLAPPFPSFWIEMSGPDRIFDGTDWRQWDSLLPKRWGMWVRSTDFSQRSAVELSQEATKRLTSKIAEIDAAGTSSRWYV